MNFVYTHLEDYIRELYTEIGVTKPKHLDPRIIAPRLGFIVIYLPCESVSYDNIIYIDSRLSEEEQWQEFCHELGHVLSHSGNQTKTHYLFREYQEWKANNFAFQACVPTFMLNNINLPKNKKEAIITICILFKVDYEFAKKRLDHYLNNHFLEIIEHNNSPSVDYI
ncbi:ImmA/IrrE family metallo-endopeptidase [Lysinibacillus sp. Ag94]|uniref:ImmA/IrrE family metallo-endopeptidase n=1 Tax=Lysinibacillus sp. Ag94 TaxID=2936682 RepID=UPI00200CDBBB|nr:ImmA/IrrE family metallo-endopeptidase [Lysinibacillus sp. Ag94]UPW82367.1 ImmA/IrrE family metallo-endopeptidase [Lysinibacillus sp. Ag94]